MGLNLKTIWGIDKISPDAYMNQIFGGTIPVSYYIYQRDEKISLEDALKDELIDQIPNTYRACRIPRTRSWSDRYLHRLLDVNMLPFYRFDNETQRELGDPNIERELLREYYLIHNAKEEFEDILHTPGALQRYRDYIAPNPIKEPFENN